MPSWSLQSVEDTASREAMMSVCDRVLDWREWGPTESRGKTPRGENYQRNLPEKSATQTETKQKGRN